MNENNLLKTKQISWIENSKQTHNFKYKKYTWHDYLLFNNNHRSIQH